MKHVGWGVAPRGAMADFMPTRRRLLLAAATGGLGFAAWSCSGWAGDSDTPWMHVALTQDPATGQWIRRFSGRAAPVDALPDPVTGALIRVREFFPNQHDPFPINDRLMLGEGGYMLRTLDRARMGMAPGRDHQSWSMNMIPFGIMLDGSFLDPSGPWFDGGPASPHNPFDRACTGWEYEVMHPVVSRLVGVPSAIAGHVQPSGLFHYHGYPRLLIANLRMLATSRGGATAPLLVGYSADGFPIVDHLVASRGDGRQEFCFSGYVLRSGQRVVLSRTNPALVPNGPFDGLFVQDYVFDPERKRREIEARLDRGESYHGLTRRALDEGRAAYVLLDPHNGTTSVHVEGYPNAVFAYVLTPDWPMVPRIFAFEPDDSFKNVIPLDPPSRRAVAVGPAGGPPRMGPGRRALYDQCTDEMKSIRQWFDRPIY